MARKTTKVMAEICLYGTTYKAGYLARSKDGRMFGDGEPKQDRSLTFAVQLACMYLREAGIHGYAWVYEPRGQLKAKIDIDRPAYYGDLKWKAAQVYVISAEEIEKHAQK